MSVYYLKHPSHGTKVAFTDFEKNEDLKHGWEEFDPFKNVTNFKKDEIGMSNIWKK
jgi:hypothetical protein